MAVAKKPKEKSLESIKSSLEKKGFEILDTFLMDEVLVTKQVKKGNTMITIDSYSEYTPSDLRSLMIEVRQMSRSGVVILLGCKKSIKKLGMMFKDVKTRVLYKIQPEAFFYLGHEQDEKMHCSIPYSGLEGYVLFTIYEELPEDVLILTYRATDDIFVDRDDLPYRY